MANKLFFNWLENILITNRIRPLAPMAESIIISFTSVDAIQCNCFGDFNFCLLLIIFNYLCGSYYPTKNRCRLLTVSSLQRGVLPLLCDRISWKRLWYQLLPAPHLHAPLPLLCDRISWKLIPTNS
jgi:hypothetical protein